MSEYVDIQADSGDEPDTIIFTTNVLLAEGEPERYDSVSALEEGSPLAQALAVVPGLHQVRLDAREMVVAHDPDVPQHVIVADISAVIRDFFL
jgi:hypothetical protein